MSSAASPRRTSHDSASGPAALAGDVLLAIGNGELRSHRLAAGTTVIGRDAGCDFVIDHRSLSRRHVALRLAGELTVQDLGSTNGTRLAGRILRGGAPVAVGPAGFRIGPYTFVVVADRGTGAPRSGLDVLRVADPTLDGVPALVRDFAATDANVLITGETGVGKEVLAATVHALSGRRGPFVPVNCAALSDTLLESELFGHERGAFTGATAQRRGLIEAAAGGTVLLDEIGELPPAMQAAILRVIERREVLRLGATRPIAVDVRFIAATNRDLIAECARGGFRADLFYRLDGVSLTIPPLRERVGAIVPLAIGFLATARGVASRLSAEAVVTLQRHAWPGNVRELKAVIERAAVLARGEPITARHLSFARSHGVEPPARTAPLEPAGELAPDQRADRDRILGALTACAGNQTRAAKLLGISRTTMITKLRIYKIARPSSGPR